MRDITDVFIATLITERRLINREDVIMTLIELSNILRELQALANAENERLRVFLATMTAYVEPQQSHIKLYL